MGIYDELGVRPVINATATLTKLGGSVMPPEVVAAMDWLQARCGHARLTGSGSAVFAEVADPVAAQAHLAELAVNWRGRVATTVANWFDNALARAGK